MAERPHRNGVDVEPILVPVPIEVRRRPPIPVPPPSPATITDRELKATLSNVVSELVPRVNEISDATADNAAQALALTVAFNKVSGRLQSFFGELRQAAKTAIREAIVDARDELREEMQRQVERQVEREVEEVVPEAVEEVLEKTNPGLRTGPHAPITQTDLALHETSRDLESAKIKLAKHEQGRRDWKIAAIGGLVTFGFFIIERLLEWAAKGHF